MHDLIKENKIECFYGNIFKNNKLVKDGGTGARYDIGDKIPYKTNWYNYTSNFNIILFGCDSFNNERQIAIVRNGKLRAIKNYNKNTSFDWKNAERCINYKGTWLNISSNEDVEKYIRKLNEYEKEKENFSNLYNSYKETFEGLIDKIDFKSKNEEKEHKNNINNVVSAINTETLHFNIKVQNIKQTLSDEFDVRKDQNLIHQEINAAFEHVIKTMKEYLEVYPNDTSYKKNYLKCAEAYNNYRKFNIY